MDMEFFTNVMGSSLVKGKRSRRFRPWVYSGEEQQGLWSCSESTQEDEHDSEDEEMAAHSLMLLSHGASSAVNHVPNPSASKRVIKKAKESHSADSPYHGEKKSSYKCKTCSKVFLSFQALGGHRASCSHTTTLAHHNTTDSEQANEKNSNKMRVHECPICYRVFSSGQALGGHKRTHSTPPPPPPMTSSATENEYEQRAELDLNMPAPLDDCYSLTEDSPVAPCSAVVRSHYNEYKLSPPFWWMNNNGKRFPLVYNGGAADEAESKVLLGQDLGLNQDLFMVATVN